MVCGGVLGFVADAAFNIFHALPVLVSGVSAAGARRMGNVACASANKAARRHCLLFFA